MCKRILEGSITYPEGAKKLKLSLSSMNRRMRLFKAEHQEGEHYGGIDSEEEEEEEEEVEVEESEDNCGTGTEQDSDETEEGGDNCGMDAEEDNDVETGNTGECEVGSDTNEENYSENQDSVEEDGNNVPFIAAMEFDFNNTSHLNHFLCNPDTVIDLVLKIANHRETCEGIIVPLQTYSLPKGHIGYTTFLASFKCVKCKTEIQFCPSPLFDGRPIGDFLAYHAKVTSGSPFENTDRFAETLGFSTAFNEQFISDVFGIDLYRDTVRDMAEDSMAEARQEVIVEGNKLDGTFDASHLIRTNSPCSCVSMLSPCTCKVLYSATVHRSESNIAQNHESVGTRKICRDVERDGCRIRSFSCDAGSGTTGVMGQEDPEAVGNLDPYHGIKNDKPALEKMTKGRDTDVGVTWHPELRDKAGPLAEHLRWCISESAITVDEYRDPQQRDEAATKLRARILIPLRHYRDIHDKCFPTARCNVDPLYDLSRAKITDPKALAILEKTLTSTTIFTQAHKYLLFMPTSMNEAYHSRQNKFFSKRTYLSSLMYNLVIRLAILDHNKNTHGVFWNGKRIEDLPVGENGLEKQPIPTRSFVYYIWCNYMLRRMAMV